MRVLSVLLLVPMLFITACNTTERFIADFEADTVNSLPDRAPAGAPDDTISVATGGGLRITNVNPVADAQSLLFEAPSRSSAFMFSEILTNDNERLIASWAGRSTLGARTIVRFSRWPSSGSGSATTYFEIVFDRGTIIFDNNISSPITIGTYRANRVHAVLFTVNRETNAYEISVSGVSGEGRASGNIQGEHAMRGDRIALQFEFDNSESGESYMVDTVRMYEGNP